MAFEPPTLFHPIDAGDYIAQVNSNFSDLQSALNEISSELAANSGGGVAAGSNFGWLTSMTLPDGVVGPESWVPEFSGDRQTLTFNVPTKGFNDAVVNGNLRIDNTVWTVDLPSVISALPDGAYRVAIQLKAQAGGVSSLLVEQADTSNDETGDLTLYEFEYAKAGALYTVKNLTRVARMILSSTLVDQKVEELVPLNIVASTPLPFNVAEEKAWGIHVPFDAEIVKAYATLAVAPTATCGLQIVKGAGIPLLASDFSFSAGDEFDTKEAAAVATVERFVEEGSFLRIDITDSSPSADGLTVTVMLRRVHHTIYN